MNDQLSSAPGFISNLPMGDKLWPILVALVILFVGLFLAKIIR